MESHVCSFTWASFCAAVVGCWGCAGGGCCCGGCWEGYCCCCCCWGVVAAIFYCRIVKDEQSWRTNLNAYLSRESKDRIREPSFSKFEGGICKQVGTGQDEKNNFFHPRERITHTASAKKSFTRDQLPTDGLTPPPIHAETETATFPLGRILDNLQLQQQIPCIYHRSLIAEYVRWLEIPYSVQYGYNSLLASLTSTDNCYPFFPLHYRIFGPNDAFSVILFFSAWACQLF